MEGASAQANGLRTARRIQKKGEKGSTEATSAAGKDGKSAYELAVQQGFSGTLDEWLASLKATGN
ncbi:hypothetical protein XM40_09265 [Bacillus velezensis]|nr:hypothetical protein XM40_09265 [Bacillus velezensis]